MPIKQPKRVFDEQKILKAQKEINAMDNSLEKNYAKCYLNAIQTNKPCKEENYRLPYQSRRLKPIEMLKIHDWIDRIVND